MNTRRVKLIALLWWFVPGSSMGIGIGDLTVTSYINQPLQANIAVLQPDGLLESEVIASLASPDDFDRLGLERHYSLNSLRFAADFSRASRPIITVTTDDPVLEPYLSFLLELKWPEGRVLREYTVLLDLPPRRSSQSSSNSSGRGLQPFGKVAIDQYRVAPNDTLGGIAAALKPSGLTIDQMMLAIKAANPNSFMRDNINGIRVGVLLAIPSDFSDVPSARAASLEVANEWDRWRAPRSSGLRIVADNELLDFAEPSTDPTSVSEEAMEAEPADADISAPSALSGGLDELLPVPSQVGSQPDNEPATGPERGYGESLLTGYAADQTLADAVAEADIYVAYGRHQHALDTLEAASAAEPSNASGLLEILDIYMSLDRIDEATGLLALIEGTGDKVALASAKSRLDSHHTSLSGDDAARELASLDDAEPAVEALDDMLDISLDLEFQEAAKPAPEDAEADASGALDAEDPAETALDLALAYVDMGDKAGAADLLQTVLSSGDEAQREHAQSLLDSLE